MHLLLIDCQNDFINGALPVKGAVADMERLTTFINAMSGDIEEVTATLDSHRTIHIAHPIWWVNSNGEHPLPYDIITKDDVNSSKWIANDIAYTDYSIEYVNKLGKMFVWPPHCLIGSTGHAIEFNVHQALQRWEERHFKTVKYITKGSNIKTEHFSAIRASVVDPADRATDLNRELIDSLEGKQIYVAGEASSHCVADTVSDLVSNFKDIENAKKITLLSDLMSPVPNCEDMQYKFFEKMIRAGVNIKKSTDFLYKTA